MDYLELKAPAKINIGLYVVEKRADGYHNIETIFYPVYDLYDKLYFKRSSFFSFDCNIKELNSLEENLAVKAVRLLEKKFEKKFDVEIFLKKNIPFGAGLGGGSSDASAVLLAINEMFKLNLSLDELKELALKLGSDCPFFIRPNPSIGRGRGEILEELKDFEINLPIALVFPPFKVSTKEAYENIKPRRNFIPIDELRNLEGKNLVEKFHLLDNDFEYFAFSKYPELKKIKEDFYRNGALFSLMSGSGSTIYGIFDTMDKAKSAIAYFESLGYSAFLSEGKANLLD